MTAQPANDDFAIDAMDEDSSVATLEQEMPKPAAPEWIGPRCEKCQAPIKSDIVSICRKCGWYASLGTFVELDQNWETEQDEEARQQVAAAVPQKSHIRVWLDLIPRWGWVILASTLAIVVESIVVRLVTPSEIGGLRTAVSLTQLAIGAFTVFGCHIFNFLVLAADDADFGVLDIVLRPLKLWMRAVQYLPTRLWVANSAACGLVAVVMSFLVIGALSYERLWDWGFKEPVKQNLMGAVMDRAKQLDSGEKDLEEAIGDFAGQAGVEENADLPKAAPEKPREKSDCVILGYQLDREGRLSSLILGAANGNTLILAGRVTPELPENERAELLAALEAIKRRDPFIRIEAEATWVEPRIACRVTYGERLKGGRLRDVKWEGLLGAMRVQ
jgi:hypothetical protein